jgi:hypothetical protein
MHDTGEHVVDLGELLINEENALARAFGVDQRRQLVFLKDVSH